MKIKMSVMITLFVLAAFLQFCLYSKKETKAINDSSKVITLAKAAPKTSVEAMYVMQPLVEDPEFLEGQMRTPVSFRMAKQIVLAHADYNIADVVFLKTAQDYEDGIVKWKINFAANDHEYEYEVNAMDGSIIKFLIKTISYRQNPYLPPTNTMPNNSLNGVGTTPAKVLSLDDAKKIIKNNTGFNMESVVYTKTECSYATGMPKWEIEFNINNHLYKYVINAIDSTIISAQVE